MLSVNRNSGKQLLFSSSEAVSSDFLSFFKILYLFTIFSGFILIKKTLTLILHVPNYIITKMINLKVAQECCTMLNAVSPDVKVIQVFGSATIFKPHSKKRTAFMLNRMAVGTPINTLIDKKGILCSCWHLAECGVTL